jgi:hypothetical protein
MHLVLVNDVQGGNRIISATLLGVKTPIPLDFTILDLN